MRLVVLGKAREHNLSPDVLQAWVGGAEEVCLVVHRFGSPTIQMVYLSALHSTITPSSLLSRLYSLPGCRVRLLSF